MFTHNHIHLINSPSLLFVFIILVDFFNPFWNCTHFVWINVKFDTTWTCISREKKTHFFFSEKSVQICFKWAQLRPQATKHGPIVLKANDQITNQRWNWSDTFPDSAELIVYIEIRCKSCYSNTAGEHYLGLLRTPLIRS